MNPWEVLGVSPSAGIEEVEARYRLLLREYHPDLHQAEGPEAIEYCEAMTRTLNDAMTRIREANSDTPHHWRHHRPHGEHRDRHDEGGTGTGTDDAGTRRYGQWAGANPFYQPADDAADPNTERAREWFGDPVEHDPNEPVPCPFCTQQFLRLVDYELHLQQAHNFRFEPLPKRGPSRYSPARLIAWMRFIPAPFVALVALLLWRFVSFESFTAAMVVLFFVVWTQTDPRFRPRR